ncbi:alpha-glucuronidase family glycosyl hydrolase [Candidatus Latescibacterota bacterium]
MKRSIVLSFAILLLLCVPFIEAFGADGYDLWQGYNRIDASRMPAGYADIASGILAPGDDPTIVIARDELQLGLESMLGRDVPLESSVTSGAIVIGTPATYSDIGAGAFTSDLTTAGPEGFVIRANTTSNGHKITTIAGNTSLGVLYGVYHYLRLVGTLQSVDDLNVVSSPKLQRRMLNHWDNLDGSIERGYAGQTLWQWDDLPDTIDPRYTDYARAMASIGLNGTVLNNVNSTPIILDAEHLTKVAALADVFRPYGIKVYLSINFGSPLKPAEVGSLPGQRRGPRGGIGTLDTADPSDPAVQAWWNAKANEIYKIIPDFGGFLVKSNSEGMPGPNDYGLTQADGAVMMGNALAPHGGIVMWRAFVYDSSLDSDRTKRAYIEFKPLDGKFPDNVIVQVKNGSLDFQAREPYNPIFGAMPNTQLMPELQVTKEYLGHSIHMVYLAPMWKEFFDFDTFAEGAGTTVGRISDGSAQDFKLTAIAGVANTGSDRNWSGHDLLQSNWYAFGRLAWDYTLTAEQIADEWICQTLTREPKAVAAVHDMLIGSREAVVNYMVPLGLHFIKEGGTHYGPDPGYARNIPDYTSVNYHRADSLGIGYDRSSTGTNMTAQYFPPIRDLYDNIETCPENLILWFHHVPWDYKLSNGLTLWDELCYKYYEGVAFVTDSRKTWDSLKSSIDPGIHAAVAARLEQHERDATIWRDTCVTYFQTLSKRPIPEDVTIR